MVLHQGGAVTARIRKIGAPKPALPHHYAALIAKEDRRIVKLAREAQALKRRLDRAKMRKSLLMRLGNDELRRGLGRP